MITIYQLNYNLSTNDLLVMHLLFTFYIIYDKIFSKRLYTQKIIFKEDFKMFLFPKWFIDNLIGDDYSWWEETITNKKVSFEFMKYLSENASASCISIVREAIQKGLDESTIKKFAKKEFTPHQMHEILEGFLLGKDYYALVEIYCNPELNEQQMFELRWCIKNGLNKEQIKSIAHPDLSKEEMREKKKNFIYTNRKNRLSDCLSKLT